MCGNDFLKTVYVYTCIEPDRQKYHEVSHAPFNCYRNLKLGKSVLLHVPSFGSEGEGEVRLVWKKLKKLSRVPFPENKNPQVSATEVITLWGRIFVDPEIGDKPFYDTNWKFVYNDSGIDISLNIESWHEAYDRGCMLKIEY